MNKFEIFELLLDVEIIVQRLVSNFVLYSIIKKQIILLFSKLKYLYVLQIVYNKNEKMKKISLRDVYR